MQPKTKTMLSFLLVLQFTLGFSMDTITVNQTFKGGDLLISKQKNFALGFFSPGSSTYRYLGIWFHQIPGQTVVWVANRNSPINDFSGFLFINQQGNLVLCGENNPVWSTNISMVATDTLAAKLLDSGNLVLVQGRTERVVWQSFDHPTNTLLPGMKVGLNRKTGVKWFLTSWRSAHDPATGNYSYRLNLSGSPQFFLYSGTKQYWRTDPWPWKAFPEVYHCDFVDHQDEIYHDCSFYDASVIVRLVLDESGFFRMLTWHQGDGQWKEFSSVPKDRCDFLGQCGAYGWCDSNTVNRFECTCLPGYEPKSPRLWHLRNGRSGCVRKRLKSSSVCGHGEGFIKVESVKLPDSAAAVWVDMSMSQLDCEQECKNDCSCSAFSSIPIAGNGSACLAWYGELMDTVTYKADMGRDLYVRVDALELGESVTRSSGFLGKKGVLSTLILSVASGWLVITIVFYFWFKSRKNKRTIKNKRNRKIFDPINSSNYFEGGSSSHPDLILFNFSTILAATNNFSPANKIGQGGFGIVYKGQLPDGQEIAVKRMSNSSKQGIQEFKNEAMLISKLQHKNLVKLLGCCIKRKEQILIYEYLPNKSLDSFIFDEKRGSLMDWRKRVDIIVGIVRGILYLHQDSRLTVIHRDLKSSNILLDADMNPKISDFGMATTFHGDQIQGKTNRVVGTYGYMSPEYAVLGKFSVKSDVFSFGVVVLEIISGKKSNGFNQQDPSLSLIGQVWELWNEGRALEIVDSSLTESYYISAEALRCIQIGLLCVQEDAMDRPTMLEVILMLKSETPLPSPKQPAFIFRTSSCNTKSPEEEVRTCSINEVTMSAVLTR